MAKEKEMKGGMCHHGMCGKCHAGTLIFVGGLILMNSLWIRVDWGLLIGGLLVACGLLKLVKPMCPHCE